MVKYMKAILVQKQNKIKMIYMFYIVIVKLKNNDITYYKSRMIISETNCFFLWNRGIVFGVPDFKKYE